ncbi:hypothetical protein BVRB_6g142700 [Beta vulgaris subsp. vulgaris]|nr:hypothetical protein BVRB_6g142700 [Beta vulgaris subsp. vulgaris]
MPGKFMRKCEKIEHILRSASQVSLLCLRLLLLR